MGRRRAKRTAGQGTIFVQGGSTWIRWRERGRKKSMRFPGIDADARDLAERTLKRVVGELAARRGQVDPKDPLPSPPLSELATEWLTRRQVTVRSWRDDASRWRCHLGPFFGTMRPDEVTVADLRKFIETALAREMSRATIRLCCALLGSLYTDLVERGLARVNVVRGLPRATRRLMRPEVKFSPFLERQEDIARVYKALPEPHATVYAIGVLAGLRPGETLALDWSAVNLEAARITVERQVRHGRCGPTKSGQPRMVPVVPQLAKILASWKLATGGSGLLFRPASAKRGGRKGAPPRFLNLHTVHGALETALASCKLPPMTLYQATRHTYAAHAVLGGLPLSALRELLGHHSTAVTERYGRLRSDMLRPSILPALTVELSRVGGEVIDLAAHRGAAGHGADMLAVDDRAADGVSTALT